MVLCSLELWQTQTETKSSVVFIPFVTFIPPVLFENILPLIPRAQRELAAGSWWEMNFFSFCAVKNKEEAGPTQLTDMCFILIRRYSLFLSGVNYPSLSCLLPELSKYFYCCKHKPVYWDLSELETIYTCVVFRPMIKVQLPLSLKIKTK